MKNSKDLTLADLSPAFNVRLIEDEIGKPVLTVRVKNPAPEGMAVGATFFRAIATNGGHALDDPSYPGLLADVWTLQGKFRRSFSHEHLGAASWRSRSQ